MSLSFADAIGNLFNVLGRCGKLVSQEDTYQASQNTVISNPITGLIAQMVLYPDVASQLGDQYSSQISSLTSIGGLAQQVASLWLNRLVLIDNPLVAQSTLTCLYEVIRQMKQQNATIQSQTVTATPTSFASTSNLNYGNGVIVPSTIRPVDGAVLENLYPESILFVCSQDSFLDGGILGQEVFSITGQPSLGIFDYNVVTNTGWPGGSNVSGSITCVDATQNNTGGNLLVNSSWSSWLNTPNVPDNWNLDVGTAGTNTLEQSTIVFGSGNSLQIVGDGSNTLTQLSQVFNSQTGTQATLSPLTQYAHNIWLRRDGAVLGSGNLTVELVDNNGNQLLDEMNRACAYNIDLTALTTSWINFYGSFRTPYNMPASYKIRYRLNAPLTNGRSVYLAWSALAIMQQLYTSGPFLSMFSGSSPFHHGDWTTITTTSSVTANKNSFQPLMARLFGEVLSNELLFPSSATPSISDSLITR